MTLPRSINSAVAVALKRLLSAYGYEIRRSNSIGRKVSTTIQQERTSAEYDQIWSTGGMVQSYLSDNRMRLYDEILRCACSAGLVGSSRLVADVGCGPGYFTERLSEEWKAKELVGFDFSEAVLRTARSACPRAIFRQHDIYLPLEQPFDLLFCIEVLEHLSYPLKALTNLVNAAPWVVVTVPNGRIDTYGGHIHFWSLQSWNLLLEPLRERCECEVRYVCGEKNILTLIRAHRSDW